MTQALSKPIDLRKDAASYVRAKLWKKRNQRLSLPVWASMRELLMKLDIPTEGAKINGIYITVFKCHENTLGTTGPFEWVVALRDVVIDTADGRRIPLLAKHRNKGRIFEFRISDIAETLSLDGEPFQGGKFLSSTVVEWEVSDKRIPEVAKDLQRNGYALSPELLNQSISFYDALVYGEKVMLFISHQLKQFCYYENPV